MPARLLLPLFLLLAASIASAAEPCPMATPVVSAASAPAYELHVDDGQLASWDLRMHVAPDLPAGVKPLLCLYAGHAVTEVAKGEQTAHEARLIAPRQTFSAVVAGSDKPVAKQGTLLTFAPIPDLLEWWKPVKRVWPVLQWQGADGQPVTVVAPHAINLGQAPTAWAVSIGSIAIGLLLIAGLALLGRKSPIELLRHDDGRLSLSQLQMAWWTVVIAVVVLYFAGLRMDVPELPESLIVLMGLSLLTTGISYKSAESTSAAARAVAGARRNWRWVDLITTADGTGLLSLARAQMLIWTLLISGIFIAKSVLTGQLWAIPWQLVALMGVSQAGYVIPKVAS